MKYGVNRQILLIIAGTVWIIAGGNILRIGIVTWMNNSHDWMFKIGEATIVFLLFFVLIFKRLYYNHTRRIEQKKETRNCPFSFFDVKSWIIMIRPKNEISLLDCLLLVSDALPADNAEPAPIL